MIKKLFFIFLFFLVLYFKIDAIDYLDTTFGSNANGIVQTTIGTTAQISGTIVDTNGNIIVAGSTTISGVQYIVAARYTSSGTLDTTFNPPGNTNAAGIVTLLPTSASSALATAVTIDLSNNVLVTGIATISGSSNIVIARLKNTDGSLDSTFGTGGVVTFNIGDLSGANSIVLDSSGNIYVTGFTNVSGTQSLFIARFTTVGQIDTTWGTGHTGYTVVNFGNGCLGNSVTIDGNANIVVGGSALPNFLVVRFGTTGLLDPTFGTGGIATTSNNGSVQAVAIDSSNRIVACGYVPAGNGNNNFALARYTTSGILDTTFNSTGLVTTSVGVSSQIFDGLIDNNGNIVVSGVSDNKFVTARYSSTGSLDTTFGPSNSGIVTTSVGLGAQANSIALQSNGKIVSGGLYVTDNVNGLNQFCLLRYNKNNTNFIIINDPINQNTYNRKIVSIDGTSSGSNATINVYLDGVLFNSVTTDNQGNWDIGLTSVLTDGSHIVYAQFQSDTSTNSQRIFIIDTSVVDSFAQGNTLRVDKIFGNDSTGVRNGTPFMTINGAIAKSQSGDIIIISPGTYNESITIPTGVIIRGSSSSTCIISQSVTQATDLVMMGENSSIENLQLSLSSNSHVQLRGVVFPGTTSATARVSQCYVIVNNATAGTSGTSNVYGIHSTGTGQGTIAAQALSVSAVIVSSVGGGNKRGLLVDQANRFRILDSVIAATTAGGAGTCYAIETNNASAAVFCNLVLLQGSTADFSQTSGSITLSGVILNNETANGTNFSLKKIGNNFIFGDSGLISSGITYLRPGTATASANQINVRISGPTIVRGLSVDLATAPGTGNSVTWTIMKTTGGVTSSTGITVTISNTSTNAVFNGNVSVNFASGDYISLQQNASGINLASDIIAVVEMF